MQVKTTMDVFDGRAFQRAMMKGARKAIEATAKAAIKDQTQRIPARIDPQGGSQRANAPSTSKRKAAALGHDIPLRGFQNILSDPKRYTIQKSGNAHMFERTVFPPNERRDIIGYLRKIGYRYWEISPELKRFFLMAMDAEMRGLEAKIDTFVKKA